MRVRVYPIVHVLVHSLIIFFSGRVVLLRIPKCQRQVQDQGDPVTIDQEHESEESLDGGFGDNVCVEAVAKIDWVNVVTAKAYVSASVLGVYSRLRVHIPARGHAGRRKVDCLTIPDHCTLS